MAHLFHGVLLVKE